MMDDRKKSAALKALHHIQGMVDAADAGKLSDTAQTQDKPDVDHVLHEASTEEDAPGGVTDPSAADGEGDGSERIDDSTPVGEDAPGDVADSDDNISDDDSSDAGEASVDGDAQMDALSEPDSGEDVEVKKTFAMLKGRKGK